MVRTAIVFSVGAQLTAALGCSSSQPTGAGRGAATNHAASGASGASTGSTPPDAAAAGSDLSCSLLTSDACWLCCVNNHPAGSQTYQNAFQVCTCAPPNGTTGACQAPCAETDCSSDPDAGSSVTGDPCDLCEQASLNTEEAGACVNPVNTACMPVADCAQFVNCMNQCP
jgi:hypothetical protein